LPPLIEVIYQRKGKNMSIMTKTGDSGETSLFSGERVSKDDLRIEVNGTIDELDAHLGEAKQIVAVEDIKFEIHDIQIELKTFMMQVASKNLKPDITISKKAVSNIEMLITLYEQKVEIFDLVISGATLSGSKLDICRTICRRAERRLYTLSKQEEVAPELLMYLNRLSDILFLFARMEDEYQKKEN
jgi:ATP:cob(I)alamin adenosyltransferase